MGEGRGAGKLWACVRLGCQVSEVGEWMDRQMGGRMDRWMWKKMGRQTDREVFHFCLCHLVTPRRELHSLNTKVAWLSLSQTDPLHENPDIYVEKLRRSS